MERYNLLNTSFCSMNVAQVLYWIESTIPMRQSAGIVELNVDVVMKMEEDAELRELVEQAEVSLLDGRPLLWIAKMSGISVKDTVPGSDLVPKVCNLAAKKGYRTFILGGQERITKKAVENIRAAYPDIAIDYYSPPVGFENDEIELSRINRILNQESPDIVFLCLGCPKQEKWWFRNRDKINTGVCLCAGATVDFLAGEVKRAPAWVNRIGFEWFYRFTQEPARLFKRYFIDDMQIFRLIMKYRKRDETHEKTYMGRGGVNTGRPFGSDGGRL